MAGQASVAYGTKLITSSPSATAARLPAAATYGHNATAATPLGPRNKTGCDANLAAIESSESRLLNEIGDVSFFALLLLLSFVSLAKLFDVHHHRRLLSFHALGSNTGTPRIFLENQRLLDLGFSPGTRVLVLPLADRVLVKRAADGSRTRNRVSARRRQINTPIVDICARSQLAPLLAFPRVKVAGYFGDLVITPSIQAFHVARSLKSHSLRVLECTAGGGTMHTAIKQAGGYEIVAASELSPAYANEYGQNAPETELIIGDMRFIHTDEYPLFDVLVSGFPCSPYSKLRRNRKTTRSKIGAEADVIIPLLALAAARMPRAIVFENVPQFAKTPFADLARQYLRNLGYHLHEQILRSPDFADIQDRARWCMVATIRPGFFITPPHASPCAPAGALLDPPDADQDQHDAARIARTIRCLDQRIREHREVGNGFGYTTISRDSARIPTLTKSMYKINQGPFVATPYGPRMLRKAELERIAQHNVASSSYALTCQIIGQGISVPTFTEIFRQLHTFLQ